MYAKQKIAQVRIITRVLEQWSRVCHNCHPAHYLRLESLLSLMAGSRSRLPSDSRYVAHRLPTTARENCWKNATDYHLEKSVMVMAAEWHPDVLITRGEATFTKHRSQNKYHDFTACHIIRPFFLILQSTTSLMTFFYSFFTFHLW